MADLVIYKSQLPAQREARQQLKTSTDELTFYRNLVLRAQEELTVVYLHSEYLARRTAQIVRMSRLWGRVGLWKHPAMVALRDRAIRSGPEGWMERAGAAQYCYDPGGLPA